MEVLPEQLLAESLQLSFDITAPVMPNQLSIVFDMMKSRKPPISLVEMRKAILNVMDEIESHALNL